MSRTCKRHPKLNAATIAQLAMWPRLYTLMERTGIEAVTPTIDWLSAKAMRAEACQKMPVMRVRASH